VNGTGQLVSNNETLVNGAKAISSGSGQLLAGSQTLQTGLGSLYDGTQQLVGNNSTLMSGITSLADGTVSLNSGVDTLKSGISTLFAGTQQLVVNNPTLLDGINSIASGATALDEGAGTLQSGVSTLYDGTQELVSNNADIIDGSNQLTDGAGQIADGSSKLHDGSAELGEGLTKLSDGTNTLADGLGDGADELSELNIGDDNVAMFSAPVESDHTIIHDVANNGHAMSAYMMSVGLWVGCMAYCIMFAPKEDLKGIHDRKSVAIKWLNSMVRVILVAMVQAILMIVLLHVFDGYDPSLFGKTILVAVIASIAFMMMFYFFNLVLDKVGSYVLLIFMVLQLSGSAGTYPIELSDSFYQSIHKFMPFTYTVDAFRSTICDGASISTEISVLMGIFVVFLVLNLIAMELKAKHIEEPKESEKVSTSVNLEKNVATNH
jgi:putative membrane protein